MTRPGVLCPVDFRRASRGALRYAAALAEHFYAELTVLAVNPPDESALSSFVDSVFDRARPVVPKLRLESCSGLPAVEILRVAGERHVEVIVMSSRGAHAPRTLLGSVTEGVLRGTTVPVIVTPAEDPGPRTLEDLRHAITRILVPVDLSPWTAQQVAIGRGLAQAVGAELLFLHVLEEPAHERRLEAHAALDQLIHAVPPELRPCMALACGDPAAHIARVARERGVDLIVMGMHTSDDVRKGMGRVTYAVLCQTPTLVVAWPAKMGAGEPRTQHEELRTQLTS